MEGVDLLILGAGWTATFLIPLLQSPSHSDRLTFAATTTNGRPVCGVDTIPFRFDPSLKDPSAIASLPRARYILITFPLTGEGQSKWLTETYEATHPRSQSQNKYRFIQFGSTGVWQTEGRRKRHLTASTPEEKQAEREAQAKAEAEAAALRKTKPFEFTTRHSPYLTSDPRAVAEDELRKSEVVDGMVLSLSGLWGGSRDPKNWVGRVAFSKEAMRHKTSLHMIHGLDIARAVVKILEACEDEEKGGNKKWEESGRGQRWMLTDGFVYDWWSLLMGWAADEKEEGEEEGEGEGKEVQPSEQAKWVMELMEEEGVQALPRSMELMGRAYDSREFWRTWGLVPVKARIGPMLLRSSASKMR
ncbi:hypothetical protein B0T20DRAFT_98534 [Sordaria brevicollis]|uniref:Uncharacterized protein n=1 Tax=Sordaria brevicollis TaxID=83679 RepID=A0AAE0NVP3_SORBR|nr:hypothetical protein B0T20DRAFT_98534 [Sordaria brevicollis]